MASLDPVDDRAVREAETQKAAVCGACGTPMAGPGTCRICIARGDRFLTRPPAGTRHARRRAAGLSRSKAGR